MSSHPPPSACSRQYVDKVVKDIPHVRLNCAVVSISRVQGPGGKPQVLIQDANGVEQTYDYVIVAAHGDDALRMLNDPTDDELAVLRPVQFTRNRAVLHCDESVILSL